MTLATRLHRPRLALSVCLFLIFTAVSFGPDGFRWGLVSAGAAFLWFAVTITWFPLIDVCGEHGEPLLLDVPGERWVCRQCEMGGI